ncbi:peptidoglycan-binding protein [Myxococcota bacterium]|nr:peptidoglycan-binding protein [Myxococcota bacterium]
MRIDRREFESRLTQLGGRVPVDSGLATDLRAAGVSAATLDEIAGDDHVISGAELGRLYDAIAVRTDTRGQRVDERVSEELFRSLAARIQPADAANPSSDTALATSGAGRARTTGIGATTVGRATDLRERTDGTQPNWFVRALESIAEFFVELFTGRDYITSAERDQDLGRQLAREHPETLRAILDFPGGEELLRQSLVRQRPSGTSEADWNRTVSEVLRGVRSELGRAPDLPDAVSPAASLRVRDRAAALYASNTDPAAQRALASYVDALASSGLSERAQVALLDRWESAGRPASHPAALERLTTSLGGVSAEARTAAIAHLEEHPESLERWSERVSSLAANPGLARLSGAQQATFVRGLADGTTDARALARLGAAQTGALAPLNDVLFGDHTLSEGARGPEVRTAQRYLRALGYDAALGPTESDTFDASTRAAIIELQRRSGLLDGTPPRAREGVLDRPTMEALVDQMQARGLSPTDYRFTTELSLNRPTRSTDGPWRATQRWTPELEAELSRFADAYVRARIPTTPDGAPRDPLWEERVDCADLSYEALIQFARQRGLPVHFSAGGTTISNTSTGPIAERVRSNFGAMHLQQFTRPLAHGETPRVGDLGNMRWNQSVGNGHDSRYWHSHNIVGFDPLFREATVIYGSLDDLVRPAALDRFNTRGFSLTIHDIPEQSIIDAINDDSGQGRQRTRPEQEAAVRRLLERHTTGGHRVTDADVAAFISMVEREGNLMRNQPTAVSARTGAFADLVDGEPWADPAARAATVADLNRRFGASFTEADIDRLVAAGGRDAVMREARAIVAARVPASRRDGAVDALVSGARDTVRFDAHRDALSDSGAQAAVARDFNTRFGARVRASDVATIVAASGPDTALEAANRIVAARGVPADRRAEAAAALVDAADSTRRFRRWDFDMFNRHM